MNEDLVKALASAQFLCDELREAHKKLCVDNPTTVQILAERHVLELLRSAIAVKNSLEGLAS